MARKRFTTEQVIHKLREAEVELSKGHSVGQVCKKIGVTEQTYHVPVCGRGIATMSGVTTSSNREHMTAFHSEC